MGDLAARVCASEIPNRFQSHFAGSKSVQQSLELSINETNELLLSISAHEQVLLSNLLSVHHLPDMVCDYGTTCVLGFVSNTSIHVLNVGDSRCVLFERLHSCSTGDCSCLAVHSNGTSKKRAASHQKQFGWSWTPLTSDHNPTLRIDERQRVEREGGQCFWNFDEIRCCPAGMTSEQARAKTLSLNMSRALGHIVLSQHGISPTPEANCIGITSTEVASTVSTEREEIQTKRWKGESSQNLSQSTSHHTVLDRFIVAGSDGLWNVVNMDDIIGVLNESSNSHEIGEALLRLADKKWIDLNPRSARASKKGKQELSIGDNVSVSVLRLVRPM
jgi:serine/threonine protein phosphatase PrpC